VRFDSNMRSVILSLPALLVLVACSGGTHSPSEGKQTTAQPATSGAQTVMISGFKYQPPIVTVKAGDTIVWRNNDIVPHTVTAAEVNHARALDSGSIAKGGSWQWVAKPGTYDYICTLHPNMKGRLTVQ
jgi:plastocyanin